jgi:hypothetical protein
MSISNVEVSIIWQYNRQSDIFETISCTPSHQVAHELYPTHIRGVTVLTTSREKLYRHTSRVDTDDLLKQEFL